MGPENLLTRRKCSAGTWYIDIVYGIYIAIQAIFLIFHLIVAVNYYTIYMIRFTSNALSGIVC